MKPPTCFLTCTLIFFVVVGCRVEHPKTRAALHEEKVERAQAKLETPHEVPSIKTDEAQLVLSSCGAPLNDTVEQLHDKRNNGPVRSLTYKGLHDVRLRFVPSRANSGPWAFSGADMEGEELLTSSRLKVYLPCAASVLR